jgi:hypothetical protein
VPVFQNIVDISRLLMKLVDPVIATIHRHVVSKMGTMTCGKEGSTALKMKISSEVPAGSEKNDWCESMSE